MDPKLTNPLLKRISGVRAVYITGSFAREGVIYGLITKSTCEPMNLQKSIEIVLSYARQASSKLIFGLGLDTPL